MVVVRDSPAESRLKSGTGRRGLQRQFQENPAVPGWTASAGAVTDAHDCVQSELERLPLVEVPEPA